LRGRILEQQVGYASWATKNSFDIVTDEIGTFSDVENPYSLRPDCAPPNLWDGDLHEYMIVLSYRKNLLDYLMGHGGSHQFMVDDFVMDAAGERKALDECHRRS
jgi:hypothetical protein